MHGLKLLQIVSLSAFSFMADWDGLNIIPCLFFILRDMESFVKTESKTVGKKKRKLQNEEYSESSSSGVQVNRNIFIMLSLNEHCCNRSVHSLASVTQEPHTPPPSPPNPTFRPRGSCLSF